VSSSLLNADLERLEECTAAMVQAELSSAIRASGLNQAEVARRARCARSTLNYFLKGRLNPSLNIITDMFAGAGFELRFSRTEIVDTPTGTLSNANRTKHKAKSNRRNVGTSHVNKRNQ
jgi:transcriptional regulator with XRE-family HTH domain